MFLIVHSASKAFYDAKNVSTSTQTYEFARQRDDEEVSNKKIAMLRR